MSAFGLRFRCGRVPAGWLFMLWRPRPFPRCGWLLRVQMERGKP